MYAHTYTATLYALFNFCISVCYVCMYYIAPFPAFAAPVHMELNVVASL